MVLIQVNFFRESFYEVRVVCECYLGHKVKVGLCACLAALFMVFAYRHFFEEGFYQFLLQL